MTVLKQLQTDSVDWHYIDVGECPAGSAPLLLVHGFPLDHSMWRFQIESLSTQTRVICPDLPGFGHSRPNDPVTDYLMGLFARELGELLDALEIEQPVDFCGLSMGGYIGWQFWRNHREKLRKLIACDTRAVADTTEVARARRMMASSISETGPQAIVDSGLLEKLFADATRDNQPELVEQTKEVILSTHPAGIAAAQLGMSLRPDVAGWLSEIDVPTLIVVGTEDVISPASEMQEIAEHIPNSEYVEIPRAGHMAPLEQPQLFNDALRQFLGGSH